jgi:hypothetical protein
MGMRYRDAVGEIRGRAAIQMRRQISEEVGSTINTAINLGRSSSLIFSHRKLGTESWLNLTAFSNLAN